MLGKNETNVLIAILALIALSTVCDAYVDIHTPYDKENVIDMREVTEINGTGTGFEIMLEDGNYYYWENE